MVNDDPYSRQRGKPQGMVGGAPVVTRPPGAPITNPMQPQTPALASPVLQRPIAPRAPMAGMSIGPDRSTGAGASGTWPPRPMAPGAAVARTPGDPAASLSMTVPPPAAKLSRKPANGLLDLSQPLMNPSDAPVFGQAAQDAATETGGGVIAGGVRAMRTAALTGAGMAEMGLRGVADAVSGGVGAAKDAAGIIGNEVAIGMGAPPKPVEGAVGIRNVPPLAGKAGATAPSPAGIAVPPAPTLSRVATNKAGEALPGSPTIGADGSVVYDDAFMQRNPDLIKRYADTNVVQSGAIPPGVAATMAGGQTPQVGSLTRAPQGFTQADRLQQLDNIERQGREYRVRALTEQATRAAQYGDTAKAAALNEQARTASIAEPPRITPLTRPDPNDAARLAIEQSQAAVQNEQTQVQTQGERVKTQQAQQLAGLQQQLLSGTPEQKQQAAAALATMQGTKPGQPLRVSRQVPIGTDAMGVQQFRKEDGVYDHSTGQVQWMGAEQKRLYGTAKGPDGKTYNIYSDGSKEEVPQ